MTERDLQKSLLPLLCHFEDHLSLANGYEYEHHQRDPEWSEEQHPDLLLQLLMPGLWLQLHSFLALWQVSQQQGAQPGTL